MDLDTIRRAADKLVNLQIRTVVGDFTHTGDSVQASAGARSIVSQINLLDGDITTAFSNDFLDPPLNEILEFHNQREQQGQEIIRDNIAALKEMVQLIAMLSRQEEADRNDNIRSMNNQST